MSFYYIVLVLKDLSKECVCCLLKPLDPIVFVVDYLVLEHAVSERELDVLGVDTSEHDCGFLDLKETIGYLCPLALDNEGTEVLFQEFTPEAKCRVGGLTLAHLKL